MISSTVTGYRRLERKTIVASQRWILLICRDIGRGAVRMSRASGSLRKVRDPSDSRRICSEQRSQIVAVAAGSPEEGQVNGRIARARALHGSAHGVGTNPGYSDPVIFPTEGFESVRELFGTEGGRTAIRARRYDFPLVLSAVQENFAVLRSLGSSRVPEAC